MAVIERDRETEHSVGYIRGFPGAHSWDESFDDLQANLKDANTLLINA